MDIGLLIADEDVAASRGATFERRDPMTGEVATRAAAATVADEFVKRFAARARSLTAGDPRGGDVALGSCIGRRAVAGVEGLIRDAVDAGADLVAGGCVEGTVTDAHVLDRVAPGMRIYHEESFGPVTCILRVRGDEEAIRAANDTEYGLSAAVFSRDIPRAVRVAKRVESGIRHINGPTIHDEAQMPFGGVKASGYGRFGARPESPSSRTCAGSRSRPARSIIRSEPPAVDAESGRGLPAAVRVRGVVAPGGLRRAAGRPARGGGMPPRRSARPEAGGAAGGAGGETSVYLGWPGPAVRNPRWSPRSVGRDAIRDPIARARTGKRPDAATASLAA